MSQDQNCYICLLCGYIYDPEVGDPYADISEGTSFSDLPDDYKFAFVSYAIYAGICAVTFVVLAVIMVKVIMKVGDTDKIIPLMLAMLQLTAISKLSHNKESRSFTVLANHF